MGHLALSFLILCGVIGLGALEWYMVVNYPRASFAALVVLVVCYAWAIIYQAVRRCLP